MENSDLIIIRGDDLALDIEFKDQDENPIDLTDCTVYFTVKRRFSDTDDEALIAEEITDHSDAENGVTTLEISHTDTESLDITRDEYPFWWDLQIKEADGTITSTLAGNCYVKPDITRRND
jgi:hypothetical protein